LVLSFWWSVSALQAALASEPVQIAIPYTPLTLTLDQTKASDRFIGRFFEEVAASDSLVFDRFTSPAARLAWARTENGLGYGALDRINGEGGNLFARIGLDSLRTAALEVLPLGLWQDYWQSRLADFIAGTIANPQEEHVNLTSGSFSALRFSWERMNDSAGIHWGLRPWRTSPYAYFLAHAGHFDGQSLVTVEARAGYKLLGATSMEGRLTFQLPGGFRLAAGRSFDLTSGGAAGGIAEHLGVTLERVVNARSLIPGSIFYIGFNSDIHRSSSNPHQANYIVAGLSKRW
jgi:hypothetical protein